MALGLPGVGIFLAFASDPHGSTLFSDSAAALTFIERPDFVANVSQACWYATTVALTFSLLLCCAALALLLCALVFL